MYNNIPESYITLYNYYFEGEELVDGDDEWGGDS